MWLLQWIDLTTFLIFLVSLLLGYYWLHSRPIGLPPGPTPWPIAGNLPLVYRRPSKLHELMDDLYKEYGSIYTLWLGPFCTIVLNDIQTIKQAFKEKSDVFSGRPTWMYILKNFIKEHGISMSQGPGWKEKRRTTMTALRDFGIGKRSIEDKIHEEAEHLCKEIENKCGRPFSISVLFSQAISNVICSIVFGQRFSYEDKEFVEMMHIFDTVFKTNYFSKPINIYPTLRFLPGFDFGKVKDIDVKMREFINNHFVTHEVSLDPKNVRDLIDLCLLKEQDGSRSRADNIQLILDVFAGGTDTTSTGLRWLMLYLLCFPNVQQECQKEVDKVLGTGKMALLADRANMPYVDATIHELLRMSNIVPIALPHNACKETELNGYTIPKNSIIFANMYSVHMNPKHFENPQKFKPERWLNKDGKVIKNEALMPFSVGPRMCMGESLAKNELFIFFSTMMQRFHFRPHNKEVPGMGGMFGLTLAPTDCLIIAEHR